MDDSNPPKEMKQSLKEIRKWREMAKMVDPTPDVHSFPGCANEHEIRWTFFAQASGILQKVAMWDFDDIGESSEGVASIF